MPRDTKNHVTSAPPALASDPEASPLQVTQYAIARLATIPDAVEDQWEAELRQISLASAASGDYKSAVEGYKELGRSFGKTAEGAPSQHVHFHDADTAKDASNEDLARRLDFLRAKRAKAQAAAEAQTADDDIDEFLGI